MHHIPIQVTEMTQAVVTIWPKKWKVNSALKKKVQLSSRFVRKNNYINMSYMNKMKKHK